MSLLSIKGLEKQKGRHGDKYIVMDCTEVVNMITP